MVEWLVEPKRKWLNLTSTDGSKVRYHIPTGTLILPVSNPDHYGKNTKARIGRPIGYTAVQESPDEIMAMIDEYS